MEAGLGGKETQCPHRVIDQGDRKRANQNRAITRRSSTPRKLIPMKGFNICLRISPKCSHRPWPPPSWSRCHSCGLAALRPCGLASTLPLSLVTFAYFTPHALISKILLKRAWYVSRARKRTSCSQITLMSACLGIKFMGAGPCSRIPFSSPSMKSLVCSSTKRT